MGIVRLDKGQMIKIEARELQRKKTDMRTDLRSRFSSETENFRGEGYSIKKEIIYERVINKGQT